MFQTLTCNTLFCGDNLPILPRARRRRMMGGARPRQVNDRDQGRSMIMPIRHRIALNQRSLPA